MWYQATKLKYEAEGLSLDNEQKRRQAQQDADSELLDAIEAEDAEIDTPLMDQLETSAFSKANPGSMTRRQFIEAIRTVMALPVEMSVTSTSSPQDTTPDGAH